MKAAIVEGKGQTPVYREFEPPAVKYGMILVDVKAAALSPFSKIRSLGNHYSSEGHFPAIAGAEGVGTAADGQRLYFFLPESPYGALAEQTLVRPEHAVPIPDELDDITAAAIANPGMSGWMALVERAKLKSGEAVLINGATGTSGRLAVQIAKHLGAGKIIVTGRNEEELQELLQLGADAVVTFDLDGTDSAVSKFEKALMNQFRKGIDVIVDYLWGESAKTIIKAADQSVEHGHPVRFVNVGTSSRQEHIEMPSSVLRSSAIQLMGSGVGSVPMCRMLETIEKVFKAVKTENLQINTEVIPLSSIEKVWIEASGKPRIVFKIE